MPSSAWVAQPLSSQAVPRSADAASTSSRTQSVFTRALVTLATSAFVHVCVCVCMRASNDGAPHKTTRGSSLMRLARRHTCLPLCLPPPLSPCSSSPSRPHMLTLLEQPLTHTHTLLPLHVRLHRCAAACTLVLMQVASRASFCTRNCPPRPGLHWKSASRQSHPRS